MEQIRVNRKAADRIASGHPWIFSSDVTDRGAAQPGAAVVMLDPRGRPLGTAHYSSTSQITLRLLSRSVEEINRDFFHKRLSAAKTPQEKTSLERQIAATDTQIDALVYQLYGLTEDEIKIVEVTI